MNIDLHSHFFPVDALSNPGKYEDRAPKIELDKGKLKVTSQIGIRAGLAEGAYDPGARIKALDEMRIDLQAISPSPILLFYWEEPAVAAHFSRKQNEAIQAVVQTHPDRFVGFGSVPLQSMLDSIAIAEEAKSMGLKGWRSAMPLGDKPWTIRSSSRFLKRRRRWTCCCSSILSKAGSIADDPLAACSATFCSFRFGRR